MNDDINNGFLEDPSEAIEEYYESVEAFENETLVDESLLESIDQIELLDDESEADPLQMEESEVAESISYPDYIYNRSDGLNIYGDDVEIVAIERADSPALFSELNEGWGKDCVYTVVFNGSEYCLLFSRDSLSDLAVRDGVLYNVGSSTIYAAVLDSDGSDLVDNLVFCFNPVASTTGIQNNLRYGGYSYSRKYTLNSTGTNYTGTDTYGSVMVVEEAPLFSGQPAAAYVTFALFVVAGFFILRKLFRRREV